MIVIRIIYDLNHFLIGVFDFCLLEKSINILRLLLGIPACRQTGIISTNWRNLYPQKNSRVDSSLTSGTVSARYEMTCLTLIEVVIRQIADL